MLEIFFYVFIGIIALAIIDKICTIIPWGNFNIKKHWFHIVFSFMAGALGFIIMNSDIGGKIIVGILFAILGWPIAMFLNFVIRLIFKNKTIITIICIIVCLLMGYFTFTREYGRYHYKDKDPYADVWNKDPNKWTDDEKEYVNDFWEWESKQQKNSKH